MAPIPPSIPITAIIHVIVANTLVIVLALGLLEELSSLGSSILFSSIKIEGFLGSDSSPADSSPSASSPSDSSPDSSPVSSTIGVDFSSFVSFLSFVTVGSSFFLGLEVFLVLEVFFLELDLTSLLSSTARLASSSLALGALLFVFFNVLFFFLF